MNRSPSQNLKNSCPGRLRNSRGQISIFIALIFNILFVFFAMVINVGMLVHDKINLQNSVDLAAYYAAMKQAEQLNAIAHTNYQIRQSWKLLAWRIRALGDIGRPNHPLNPLNPASITSDAFLDGTAPGAGPSSRQPSVCIAHSMWADGSGSVIGKPTEQNLCERIQFSIPKIPDSPVIFGVLPINAQVQAFATQQQNVSLNSCQDVGALDWALAAQWYLAYRFDISNKKKAVRIIAQELSKADDDFVDVTGASVRAGALATLQNNLTRANLDGLGSNVTLYNSLSGDWTDWLHEIFIYPLIYYADISGNISSGCSGDIVPLNATVGGALTLPTAFKNNPSLQAKLDPNDELSQNLSEPTQITPKDDNSLSHSSAGYEKNPWKPAYVGFKATTKVLKPFAPFGGSVQLVARAFAKPFGGRIGPWMYNTWPSGQNSSKGQLTDDLLPLGLTTSSPTPGTQNYAIPNYSRFPGDIYGLSSTLALSAMKSQFVAWAGSHSLVRAFWGFLPSDVYAPNGDVLAVTNPSLIATLPNPLLGAAAGSTVPPWIRRFELAAVAPDLFDITYYSIEPQFYKAYGTRAAAGTASGGPSLLADIGQHSPKSISGSIPGTDNLGFDINQQMNNLAIAYGDTLPSYIIKSIGHVLTGWVTTGAYDYSIASAQPALFGECHHLPLNDGVPGCVEGGRTGYSVKLVSKSYLSGSSVTSGPNTSADQIVNQPPPDF